MNGQWLGKALVTITDTIDYLCMLNLDLKDESYEGRVLLFYLPFQKVSQHPFALWLRRLLQIQQLHPPIV